MNKSIKLVLAIILTICINSYALALDVPYSFSSGGLIRSSEMNTNFSTIYEAYTALGSQLNVDNLRLDGNTISAVDAGGSINLTPNGTGMTTISRLRLNNADNIYWNNTSGSAIPALTFHSDDKLYIGNTEYPTTLRGSNLVFQGMLSPYSNNTYDIGGSAYRLRNIYSYDGNFADDITVADNISATSLTASGGVTAGSFSTTGSATTGSLTVTGTLTAGALNISDLELSNNNFLTGKDTDGISRTLIGIDNTNSIWIGDPGLYLNTRTGMRIAGNTMIGTPYASPLAQLHILTPSNGESIIRLGGIANSANAKNGIEFVSDAGADGVCDAGFRIYNNDDNLIFSRKIDGGGWNNVMHFSRGSSVMTFPDGIDVDHNAFVGGYITVTGAINGGSLNISGAKYFLIDHPVDGTKKLRHAAVESPVVGTQYWGSAIINNGSAVVNIDTESNMSNGTFEALNTRAMIVSLLNPTSGTIATATSIVDGQFVINCNCTDGETVNWLVVAERKDEAIINSEDTDNAGRLIPEFSK